MIFRLCFTYYNVNNYAYKCCKKAPDRGQVFDTTSPVGPRRRMIEPPVVRIRRSPILTPARAEQRDRRRRAALAGAGRPSRGFTGPQRFGGGT
jgi:hypothetical protein